MKITCQSCQSKYNVADEKVQGKIVKIRCRKCGATIVVQGNGGAATNGSGAAAGPSGAAAGGEGDGQWHVNVGEGDPRTMSMSELVDAYNAGVVGQDTFIWTDGMDDWKPLSEVETVVEALHAGSGSAPAPLPQEPAYTAPAYTAPEPAHVAAAAAPVAVSMSAEPRRAAVAKREARGARDLFGGGVGAEEVQTSAPANPQLMAGAAMDDAASKMTGQRNENSVLFSLAVLTKDAGERPEEPAPRSTGKSSDDSGLIDLKALAAKAESMRPAAGADNNAFASPLGLGGPALGAPLGVLGSPLGEAPKSKLPLYIGGGAGVILLLVLGIVIGVKVAGGGAAPEASAMASTAPTVTASATAEPSATASAAPTAEASAAPSASVAAKPKATTYHAPGGGGAKPPTAGGGASTAATGGGAATTPTPPPPKKAGSDCGCNGDLMCLMKCSTH